MPDHLTPGQVAYAAFVASTAALLPEHMPTFADLTPVLQRAWEAAAQAVRGVRAAPLSPEGYAATGGKICPFCGGNAVPAGVFVPEGACVLQRQHCLDCHEAWIAVYELTGYEAAGGGAPPDEPAPAEPC